MRIAVVNTSTSVSSHQLDLMVRAVQVQLAEHWAPAWSRVVPQLYVDRDALDPDAFPIYIADNIETQLLGFHTKDPQGRFYGKVSAGLVLQHGGDVLSSGMSISVILSHEAIELANNPGVNLWVDGPATSYGSQYAHEPCDPVESSSYSIDVDGTAVAVSNFVMPSWFERPSVGPFDYLGELSAPFTMAPGGYMIVRTAGADTSLRGASIIVGHEPPPDWKLRCKVESTLSRTGRRLLSCKSVTLQDIIDLG